jgi:hypothetical protein
MKYVLMLALIVSGSVVHAGECVNGSCRNVRNKVVNVTTEVLSVPVLVTRKTIEVTRNTGRKTINRLRSIVK